MFFQKFSTRTPINNAIPSGRGADDGGNLISDFKGIFNSFKPSEEAKADEQSNQSNPNTLLDEALTWMKVALYVAVLYTILLNGWVTYHNYLPAYGQVGAIAATALLVVLIEVAKIKFGGMFAKSIAFGWLFRLRPQAAVYLIAGGIAAFTFWKSYEISTKGVAIYAENTSRAKLMGDAPALPISETPKKDYAKGINGLLNEKVEYQGKTLIREKSLTTAKNLSAAAVEAERNEGKRIDLAGKAMDDKRKDVAIQSGEAAKSAADFGGLAEWVQFGLILAIAFCRRALVALYAGENSPTRKKDANKGTEVQVSLITHDPNLRVNGQQVTKNETKHRQIGFHRVDENGRITPTQTPVHPPLMTPLMAPIHGTTFDEVWNRLQGQKTDWLDANRDLARRVAERYQTIAKIADTYGIGRGQAAQMLPATLTINAIAAAFNCSASQVNIVRRVVEHIELPDMGVVIGKGGKA